MSECGRASRSVSLGTLNVDESSENNPKYLEDVVSALCGNITGEEQSNRSRQIYRQQSISKEASDKLLGREMHLRQSTPE